MAAGKYETHVKPKLLLIEAWARDGLTDEDIAKNLDIGISTFHAYKKDHSELVESLKRNKDEADIIVENSLYKRATGYSYEEVTKELMDDGELKVTKVVKKEVVPDTTAQIFWLKNRRPAAWRDKHEMDVKSEVVNKHEYHIEQTITTDPESAQLLKQLWKRQSAVNATVGDPSET